MVSALPALSQKEWPLAWRGMGGHFFLPLEIVHVIWKVTKTAPPIRASSWITSLSVIEHPPFRSRVRGSKKIFVSTGAWPEERDHLHLQTVPAAISDGSFRISQLLTKYNSVFLVRLLPALQKGSAVVFFSCYLWYTIVYFDLSFVK